MRNFLGNILLIVYLTFLLLPYFPVIQFYVSQHDVTQNTCNIKSDNVESLTGDLCYLMALLKRAELDKQNQKSSTPPPAPSMETNNLVYIASEAFVFPQKSLNTTFKFKQYAISIKETFREVPNPPPRLFS